MARLKQTFKKKFAVFHNDGRLLMLVAEFNDLSAAKIFVERHYDVDVYGSFEVSVQNQKRVVQYRRMVKNPIA